MKIGNLLLLLQVLTLIFGTGCATIDSLQPGGGYKLIIEGKSYDEVWRASVKAVSASMTIVESRKDLGIIKAEKGAGLSTWGEVAGVFISPANVSSSRYTVEVVSEKRAKYQITGQDWTLNIVEGIKAELGI